MKFILFVEGFTEAQDKRLSAYLKRWLDPKLRQPVGLPPVRFEGWAEFVKDAPIKARMHLEGPHKSEIIGIIGLLDLYGPTIYPNEAKTVDQRFKWLKTHLETQVGQRQYRQFAAVHEVEAWLLGHPEVLPRKVREELPAKVARPETVNFDEPPAKLLERLYERHVGRRYRKRVDGPTLFDKADPEEAYKKCPYLRELLDEMLLMAHKAGL